MDLTITTDLFPELDELLTVALL